MGGVTRAQTAQSARARTHFDNHKIEKIPCAIVNAEGTAEEEALTGGGPRRRNHHVHELSRQRLDEIRGPRETQQVVTRAEMDVLEDARGELAGVRGREDVRVVCPSFHASRYRAVPPGCRQVAESAPSMNPAPLARASYPRAGPRAQSRATCPPAPVQWSASWSRDASCRRISSARSSAAPALLYRRCMRAWSAASQGIAYAAPRTTPLPSPSLSAPRRRCIPAHTPTWGRTRCRENRSRFSRRPESTSRYC